MTSFAFGTSISASVAPALFITFLPLSSLEESQHWVLPPVVALHYLVQVTRSNRMLATPSATPSQVTNSNSQPLGRV